MTFMLVQLTSGQVAEPPATFAGELIAKIGLFLWIAR